MTCMCGDTQCPSCGRAQGTYEESAVAGNMTLRERLFKLSTDIRHGRINDQELIAREVDELYTLCAR